MFLRGAVAAITACVTKAAHLMALRFLLGVFEAGFSVRDIYTPQATIDQLC